MGARHTGEVKNNSVRRISIRSIRLPVNNGNHSAAKTIIIISSDYCIVGSVSHRVRYGRVLNMHAEIVQGVVRNATIRLVITPALTGGNNRVAIDKVNVGIKSSAHGCRGGGCAGESGSRCRGVGEGERIARRGLVDPEKVRGAVVGRRRGDAFLVVWIARSI